MDIRTKRTYKMLADAFEELVRGKRLEDITVSELCALSTVRRATFYRHFSDMQAFVRYFFTTITERFMEEIADEQDLGELYPYAAGMHARMLRYADENRVLFRHIMGTSMLADTMDMIIVQVADGIISRINSGIESGIFSPLASAEAIGLYYSAGLVHSMRWRLLDDKPSGIDEVVETGMAMLQGMLAWDPAQKTAYNGLYELKGSPSATRSLPRDYRV